MGEAHALGNNEARPPHASLKPKLHEYLLEGLAAIVSTAKLARKTKSKRTRSYATY